MNSTKDALNRRDSGKNIAVVLAAGSGTRFSSTIPKAYLALRQKPMLIHAINHLLASAKIDEVLPVIGASHLKYYESLKQSLRDERILPAITGGDSRAASVQKALQWLSNRGNLPRYILVHDAARPIVPSVMIDRLLDTVKRHPAVIPMLHISDAVVQVDQCDEAAVIAGIDRRNIRKVQTPQAFDLVALMRAHANLNDVTENVRIDDDADVCRHAGIAVVGVTGEASAHKLTREEDLPIIETALARSSVNACDPDFNPALTEPIIVPEYRSASGVDVHELDRGDGVILGGYLIKCEFKLTGHSDADVVLHAITDGILALCCAGDIGELFPPSDPRWKGADSTIFLNRALELLTQAQGTLTFVDTTIICEEPKISPHRQAIRQCVAKACNISLDRVAIKATTSEGLGFTGRREGIAAIATITGMFEGL